MILYTLKCKDGHAFESWFRDSSAYDALAAAGQIACAVCGNTTVDKAIMAPAVGSGRRAAEEQPAAPASLSEPANPAEAALHKLREHLETNSDYVGRGFAEEARRIHLGEADARSIWGEATPADAKALHDEGIPVAPLPPIARRDD